MDILFFQYGQQSGARSIIAILGKFAEWAEKPVTNRDIGGSW
jgi:hypothetical protein